MDDGYSWGGKRSETMLGSMCELMWRGKTVNYYDETSESLYVHPLIHGDW